jgi:hypothetical protein
MTAMAIMLPVPLVTYTVNRREDCGSFVYDHLLIKMFNENGDSTNGMGFSIAAIRSAFLMGRRSGCCGGGNTTFFLVVHKFAVKSG